MSVSFVRCQVSSVEDSALTPGLKVVNVVALSPYSANSSLHLSHPWCSLNISSGNILNISGPSAASLPSVVTFNFRSKDILVLHPDTLVTATAASNASSCLRRPVLESRFRATSPPNEHIILGNILHQLFQTCLLQECWDDDFVHKIAHSLVLECIDSWWLLDIDMPTALKKVIDKTVTFKQFATKYIYNTAITTSNNKGFHLTKATDVEEDITSARFGLKGKVDVSMEAVFTSSNAPACDTVAPLEFKTGRWTSFNERVHRAQTLLYTLLMSDRHSIDVTTGVLYYLSEDKLIHVNANLREIQDLMMARNELASYMHLNTIIEPQPSLPQPNGVSIRQKIPDPIDERTCHNCYAKDICMLYRRAIEKDDVGPSDTELAETYQSRTSHLTENHKAFFSKWEDLISLEEQEVLRHKRELWTLTAPQRERANRCWADMVPDQDYISSLLANTKRSQNRIRFHKKDGSMLKTQMSVGEHITVSQENGKIALAHGFVVHLDSTAVTVTLDRTIPFTNSKISYRIDKDELSTGMGRLRDNLSKLFSIDGNPRLLDIIVDLIPPRFEELESQLSEFPKSMLSTLNESQKIAVSRALSAKDYSMILGMPGTGKTQTTAELIRQIVARGQSVLLTSYQHSAVDNILLRLLDSDLNILRLGDPEKVLPSLRHMTLDKSNLPETLSELDRVFLSPQVVATTCLSIGDPLFYKRKFDYCIIDEASQLTLPTCLGPIEFADVFVLVGDHNQLPPLVRNQRAKTEGLEISLFKHLSDAHESAISYLTHQYRMSEDIMSLSNHIIYENRLVCGSEEVANRRLSLDDNDTSDNEWLNDIIRPEQSVVFIDTDDIPSLESAEGSLLCNEGEAQLIRLTVEELLRRGLKQSQIGVIAHYRKQTELISQKLSQYRDIEILTADKSQGRDKDCVLMSFTRSNTERTIGELLKDWRRINVCITRAKSKLILYGSRKTLSSNPTFERLFELLDKNQWIIKLPTSASSDIIVSENKNSQPSQDKLSIKPTNVDAINATKYTNNISLKQKQSPTSMSPQKKRPTKVRRISKYSNNSTGTNSIINSHPILKELMRNR